MFSRAVQTIIFACTCVALQKSFVGLILLLHTPTGVDQAKRSSLWENKDGNSAVAGANPNLYVHLLTGAIRK